jgi:CHAT domain-containing protein
LRILLIFIFSFLILTQHVFSNTPVLSDKELLAKFDNPPLPPKNINDVIRLLDSTKPDLEKVKKFQEILNSNSNPNFTKNQLYIYARDKYFAAEFLGDTKKFEELCKLIIENAEPTNRDEYLDAQMSCVNGEVLMGQNQKAYDRLVELGNHPTMQGGARLGVANMKMNTLRNLGDVNEAEKLLPEMERYYSDSRRTSHQNLAVWGDSYEEQIERFRGEYYLLKGKSALAETHFKNALVANEKRLIKQQNGFYADSARRVHTKEGIITGRAILRELLARSLSNQGKLIESEYQIREALKINLSVGGRNNTRVASNLSGLAYNLAEQGRGAEANILTEYTIKVLSEIGMPKTSSRYLNAVNARAASLVGIEKYNEALVQFEIIRSTVASDEDLKKSFKKFDLDEVVALIYTNNYSKAESISKPLYELEKNRVGERHSRTVYAQAFYAVSLQGQNKTKEAKENYKSALPILTDYIRNSSESGTFSLKNKKRFETIAESYMSLLFDEAKLDPKLTNDLINDAFLLSDLARGSSVQKALSQSTARSNVNIKDSKLGELARKEQDLQRQISNLNDLLVSMSYSSGDKKVSELQAKINNDISNLKSERESVKNSIKSSYPEYLDLIEPKPINIERSGKLLKPSEVLVNWYFGDKKSFVWAINQSGLSSFASINLTKKDIARDVKSLRKSLDPGVSSVDEIPIFDVNLSYKLYTQLIKPVESSLVGKDLLISVPHEALGQLPIGVLLTQQIKQPVIGSASFKDYQNAPWLVRKIAISQIPSVNSLASLRFNKTERNTSPTFIAFADPYFSKAQASSATKVETAQLNTRGKPLYLRSAPKTSNVSSAELALLPRLPDTSLEVNEIGKVLNAKAEDIFLHEHANVKKVMETDFSKKSIIMFSTHGLVPGELMGLTQPALALSAPDVSGEKEGDGLLTMNKILELKLNADWVVLSACNTASGGASSESVSGLGRAFFYAGAKALLVSNWPVDTVSSRELMVDLFKRQNNQDGKTTKPQALREAMLNIADKGGSRDPKTNAVSYSYAHPLFWAPFVMVGD